MFAYTEYNFYRESIDVEASSVLGGLAKIHEIFNNIVEV